MKSNIPGPLRTLVGLCIVAFISAVFVDGRITIPKSNGLVAEFSDDLQLRIHFKHRNTDALEAKFHPASDSTHPDYSKHSTQAELPELVGGPQTEQQTVNNWLSQHFHNHEFKWAALNTFVEIKSSKHKIDRLFSGFKQLQAVNTPGIEERSIESNEFPGHGRVPFNIQDLISHYSVQGLGLSASPSTLNTMEGESGQSNGNAKPELRQALASVMSAAAVDSSTPQPAVVGGGGYSSSGDNTGRNAAIIGVISGGAGLLLIVVLLCAWSLCGRRQTPHTQLTVLSTEMLTQPSTPAAPEGRTLVYTTATPADTSDDSEGIQTVRIHFV